MKKLINRFLFLLEYELLIHSPIPWLRAWYYLKVMREHNGFTAEKLKEADRETTQF